MLLVWVLRAVWVVLPLTVGPALLDALDGWSAAPRTTAEVVAWVAWGVGLVAVLAPRPLGLTFLRVAAPSALLASAASAPSAPALEAGGALATAGLAASLVVLPEIATLYANGASYGDEHRFPLRAPPVVAWLVGPLASAATATGAVAGPLLLADGSLAAGVPVTVVGGAVAAFLARSLHALSKRWLIAVPGGFVLHDPLTLADPVLLPRDRLGAMGPLDGDPPAGATDLRLGTAGPGLHVRLREPVTLAVVGRNRRVAELVETTSVLVTPARRGDVLREAQRRRLPLG